MIGRYEHLPVESRELLVEARRIGEELASLAENGEPRRLNRPLVRALATHGLLRRLYDGSTEGETAKEPSALELCLIREGLALSCTVAETAFAAQGLGSYPIFLAGSSELKARWLPGVAAGETVAAFALTEPEAGSDVAALSTSAQRDDGGWRLNGTKTFISNAPDADLITVFARSDEGITAFAVPGEAEGLAGDPLELLGPHPVGRFELTDVFVPEEGRIGDLGRGMQIALRTLNLFRSGVGAFAVGLAQRAIDAAVEHTASRQAFGSRLSDFQSVSHRLADLHARVHAARLAVHDAARAVDQDRREQSVSVAVAKLLATETAQAAVDAAIQFHGGRALEQGHLLERLYREVRAPRIYEGASEIQREIIARGLYDAR